jgi:hypothetical protein
MPVRFASAGALLAAVSMAATSLAAADFPRTVAPVSAGVLSTNGVNSQDRRWHRRDRVDGGDVVAGVLVVGAIAAIASAASNAKREREYRYPQGYPARVPSYDYRSGPGDSRYDQGRGIDRAVDMCAREVERNSRVESVDGVERSGDGWRVTGRLANGDPFACSVGSDGRIGAVDYGSRGAVTDRQWDDDRYAAARRAQDVTAAPSYPGGPVGDEVDADDGRYDTAATPDFEG